MSRIPARWPRAIGIALVAAALLTNVSSASAQGTSPRSPTCALGDDGCFLDLAGVGKQQAAALSTLGMRGEAHYVRAVVEAALMLGGGTAWYWIDRNRQVADWDFPSLKDRLTFEAWRYDNNPFAINFIWHAMNGSAFHTAGRSNGLSMWGALGLGFASSMVWEYALEFREKISISDVMVTPGAGTTLGEFVHWLGRYVNSAPGGGGWKQSLARWTLGVPRAAHERLDGTGGGTDGVPLDNLGFRSDIWHQFRASIGVSRGSVASEELPGDGALTISSVKLHGSLVALPGYLRPGRFSSFFADGNVTQLDLELSVGGSGTGTDLQVDTMLLGLHLQDVARHGATGTAVTLGLNLGYRYLRQSLGLWRDRMGVLHIPGPAVRAHLVGPRWRLRASAYASGDFAGINALSHARWKRDNPDVLEKTILRREGYYYGWGWSTRAEVELTTPWIDAGVFAARGDYSSDEGLDRSQETINFDIRASDELRDYAAWLRAHLPGPDGAYIELKLSQRSRNARIDSLRASERLREAVLRLGMRL